MIRNYKSKRTPRVKQQEALDRSESRRVFAFLMAMRTGKTKVTLDDFGRLYCAGQVDDLLIIAPAGVYKTWEKAIPEDWPEWLVKSAVVHVWESGTYKSEKRKGQFANFMGFIGPRVLIMNIEALSMTDNARDAALEFCGNSRKVYCAIDESTIIKNPSAECTKFCVLKLAPLTTFRRILSGLITPKSPLDLFAQFAFLDRDILGFKKFTAFRARFAVMQSMQFGGRMVPVVVGHRDTEILHEKIAPHSFRVQLQDCYDLPPDTYTIREVPMTKAQEKHYNELLQFATTAISAEQHVSATVVIAQITKLHQILCGHVTDELGGFVEIPERRTETLMELLEQYEGKAIIWCSYDYNIQKVTAALRKEYGEKSVARFWGGNRNTREQEEQIFKTDPECRFMVATPHAGGRGRTWDCANLVVYYSNTNDLEKRSQSEERPKGVGKDVSIQYVDLQVPGTVEEKFIYALRNKINLASIINGDTWREWLV